MKKWIAVWAVGLAMTFYTTLVLMCIWNWYAAPALNLGELSYWQAYGISLLIEMFGSISTNSKADIQFKVIAVALEVCVPRERQDDLKEAIARIEHGIWDDMIGIVVGRVFALTFTLAVGWLVYTIIM